MRNRNFLTIAALLAVGLLAACSTESPTAPQQTPLPRPGSTGPSAAWNITVTASPRELPRNGGDPATITIRVQRASDGAVPPNGTTIVVGTSLGALGSASGESSAVASLINGLASLLLFAGDLTGQAVVSAQLEASVGQTTVTIKDPEILFISNIVPTSGSSSGGTVVVIKGTGFSAPLKVDFGGILASNLKVSADGKEVTATTRPVPIPEEFFGTEGCDSDGDGTLDGRRFVAERVTVRVELQSGGSAGTVTLPEGFTYVPADRSCKPTTPRPNFPSANFTFTTNGLTVLFQNQSSPAGVTFTWIFGDGSAESTEKDPVHTYAVAGSYDVTLRAVNSAGSSTVTKTVTVP